MNLTDNQIRLRDALPAAGTGGTTPRTLADTTGLGYSTVTRLLRELHELGLAATGENGWHRPANTTPAAGGHHEQADPDPDDEPDGSGDQTATPDPATPGDPDDDDAATSGEPPRTPDGAGPDAADPDGTGPAGPAEPGPSPEPDGDGSSAEPPAADQTGTGDAEAGGTGGVTAGKRMRKGELRELVLAALRDADGQPLGPTELSKRLDGRSQGAIANACDKLVADGLAVLTSDRPRRFAAVPTT